jgi:hypothetical protein
MKIFITTLLMLFEITGCADSSEFVLEGKLYFKGSSPQAYLVIEEKKTKINYKINNKESFGLMKKEKHNVKIKVKMLDNRVIIAKPKTVEVLELLE